MNRRMNIVGAGILLGLLIWQSSGFAAEPDDRPLTAGTIRRVVEQVEPSTVSILRVRPQPAEAYVDQRNPDPEDRELLPNDYGAGILIQPADGDELFVLTAYHVVRGGVIDGQPKASQQSQLQLRFHNRRTCLGQIHAADPRSDLAVLTFDQSRVEGQPGELKPLDWLTKEPARKGDVIVCLGNPYALARDGSASVSWGIVSNLARRPIIPLRREMVEQSLSQLGTVLQIDSRLQLGGSGGPVVNLDGQLVGIATALAAIEGYEKSAGFAIPVDVPMRRVIATLLAGQEVEYGLLGVTPASVDQDRMRELRLFDRQPTAVEVNAVPLGSPAARQDQIQVKDILLTINGQTLFASADLMRIVGEYPPETEVTVELFRPGRGQVLTVRSKLGKWPVRDDEGIVATRPKYPAWRGLRVDYPSARQKYNDQRILPGVIVVGVAADSRAAQAQLQPGDVITRVDNIPVQTPGEFQKAVANLTGNVVVQLYAQPGDRASATIAE